MLSGNEDVVDLSQFETPAAKKTDVKQKSQFCRDLEAFVTRQKQIEQEIYADLADLFGHEFKAPNGSTNSSAAASAALNKSSTSSSHRPTNAAAAASNSINRSGSAGSAAATSSSHTHFRKITAVPATPSSSAAAPEPSRSNSNSSSSSGGRNHHANHHGGGGGGGGNEYSQSYSQSHSHHPSNNYQQHQHSHGSSHHHLNSKGPSAHGARSGGNFRPRSPPPPSPGLGPGPGGVGASPQLRPGGRWSVSDQKPGFAPPRKDFPGAPISSSPYDRSTNLASSSDAPVNALAGVLRHATLGGQGQGSLRPTPRSAAAGGHGSPSSNHSNRDSSPVHRPRPSTEPRKKLPELPPYGSAGAAGIVGARSQLNRVFPERQPSSNNNRVYGQQTSSPYGQQQQPRQNSAPATPTPERQQQQQQQHWVELFDEKHQRPYFFNPKTHETRWTPPENSRPGPHDSSQLSSSNSAAPSLANCSDSLIGKLRAGGGGGGGGGVDYSPGGGGGGGVDYSPGGGGGGGGVDYSQQHRSTPSYSPHSSHSRHHQQQQQHQQHEHSHQHSYHHQQQQQQQQQQQSWQSYDHVSNGGGGGNNGAAAAGGGGNDGGAANGGLFCFACALALKGPHMEVDSTHRYHPECLVCKMCGSSLVEKEFFVYEDELYCESDYSYILARNEGQSRRDQAVNI